MNYVQAVYVYIDQEFDLAAALNSLLQSNQTMTIDPTKRSVNVGTDDFLQYLQKAQLAPAQVTADPVLDTAAIQTLVTDSWSSRAKTLVPQPELTAFVHHLATVLQVTKPDQVPKEAAAFILPYIKGFLEQKRTEMYVNRAQPQSRFTKDLQTDVMKEFSGKTLLLSQGTLDRKMGLDNSPMATLPTQVIPSTSAVFPRVRMKPYSSNSVGIFISGANSQIYGASYNANEGDALSSQESFWYDFPFETVKANEALERLHSDQMGKPGNNHNEVLTKIEPRWIIGLCLPGETADEAKAQLPQAQDYQSRFEKLFITKLPIFLYNYNTGEIQSL